MPDLPHLSGREIIRALERLGFVQARQRGSHVVMKIHRTGSGAVSTPEGNVGCVVPLHREVAIGTLRSILKQAHVSADEFTQAVKEA